MTDRLARIVFFVSLAALVGGGVFLWGYETHRTQAWPEGLIEDSRVIARSLKRYQRIVPTNLLHTAPPQAAAERVVVHDPTRMVAGWYVVLGWDADRGAYAAWLLDETGREHHAWPIDYRALDPDGPLNGSDTPHGMLALADGSLLLNFDHGDVMARLDACGEAMWVRPGIFHHSLDLADDGTVWTWQGHGTPYAHHHTMIRFDPATGETLEAIDLVRDIIEGDVSAEIVMGTRATFPFQHFDRSPENLDAVDLFHPNDVEELDAALAAAFPMFSAGDLLVSLRNNDLVAIVDRATHRLKWWSHGPWIRQHDPDFLPDGRISVYNNNTGRGRSEVVTIDPATRAVASPLHDGPVRFYSKAMGKHQTLPGGNVLIVVPEEGRVVIASATGERVWEFNNLAPGLDGVHAHVCNALWLPPDHFADVPGCARQ